MLGVLRELVSGTVLISAGAGDGKTSDETIRKSSDDAFGCAANGSADVNKGEKANLNLLVKEKLNFAKDWTAQVYRKVVNSSGSTADVFTEKINNINIQHIFDKVPVFRDFQHAQTEFVSEQHSRQFLSFSDPAVDYQSILPWNPDVSGLNDEAVVNQLRARILALSEKPNTFLLHPPAEAKLDEKTLWSPETVQLAKALLLEDCNLALMRYKLVPRKISEEVFWRNYFYRLSVVQQSFQLSALTGSGLEDFVCVDEDVSSKRTEVKTTDEARNECIQKESVRPRLLTEFCTGSATKHGASPTPEPESKTSSGACTEQKSSGSDSNDVTETKPTNVLSLDEQLEAELAREVDSMVLITSANDPQVDELDRELELELLSELNQMQKT